MTNQITKPQKCIVMRNGLELWVDAEVATTIESDWISGRLKGPLRVEGRVINTADISAFVLPGDMYDLSHRKNGQWKCRAGKWHDRGEKCSCPTAEQQARAEARAAAIKACGKCDNGFIRGEGNTVRYCDCVLKLK